MSASASAIANPAATASAVIGKTVVINGDVRSGEPLNIQGQVIGTVAVAEHLLTIASGADVQAQITARNLEVQGRIEGQVHVAETVFIRKEAEFIGDIRASSLVIEEGGYIKGNIDLTKQAQDGPFESAARSAAGSGLAESRSVRDLSHAVLSA